MVPPPTTTMTTSNGRASIADFIAMQEAASDGERLVQLCIVDHESSGHLHLQAHFSGQSISPWEQVNRATVADVRATLQSMGPARSIRIHLHGEERKNPPAIKEVVDALPRVSLSHQAAQMLARGDGDDSTCNICLEEYEDGATLVCMPCRGLHKFHEACMLTWLENASTCPCCQWPVPADTSKARIASLMAPAQAECIRLAQALPPPCLPAECMRAAEELSDSDSDVGSAVIHGAATADVPAAPDGRRRGAFGFLRNRVCRPRTMTAQR